MIEDNREEVSGRERRHYRRGAIHHPDFCQSPRSRTPGAGRQDEGDPAYRAGGGSGEGGEETEGDREYVPSVSDFIISVRRNVRHPTKARPRARKRDLMRMRGREGGG